MTGAGRRWRTQPGRRSPMREQPIATASVDDLLDTARSDLARLDPAHASRAIRGGAILIDTRPEWQRRADGEIPGALIVERNHLEWRCDPSSPSRLPHATGHHVAWIICCDEGYSSSLAAASLRALGLHNATDLAGGFQAWRAARLPVTHPTHPSRPQLPQPAPNHAATSHPAPTTPRNLRRSTDRICQLSSRTGTR